MDSFSEIIDFIESTIKTETEKDYPYSKITIFFKDQETENAFIKDFLTTRKYIVVGIAEETELLEPFKKIKWHRGMLAKGDYAAEDVIELVVSMIPNYGTEMEGDWDGMVLLRNPKSVSTLSVISACAGSNRLFLITTIVDPLRHMILLYDSPGRW